MIEVMWAQILHQELRMAALKWCAPPPPLKKNVTMVGDVLVPEAVAKILNKGPKFSLEPDVKGQEWISLNRQIARKAPEEKHEKCLLDGVDALMKAGSTDPDDDECFHATNNVSNCCKENRLSILESLKIGVSVWLLEVKMGP
ncbi:hypothetical protein HPB50_004036 [Hyalomma asiaticum]|uniref:Uncharacterized protein n=1 Tax=Hyalomma asiaticum TaxID=266040 RepID=A0ACB7ST37_HYAAI|nr:hypothetical protein HPB50_004036 [Hyalomma asiaticum]